MPGFVRTGQPRPIDYFILQGARSFGRDIGFFAGKKISEAVVDAFGQYYVYSGVAARTRSGKFDIDGLQKGELIVLPGLVYRHDAPRKGWRRIFLGK